MQVRNGPRLGHVAGQVARGGAAGVGVRDRGHARVGERRRVCASVDHRVLPEARHGAGVGCGTRQRRRRAPERLLPTLLRLLQLRRWPPWLRVAGSVPRVAHGLRGEGDVNKVVAGAVELRQWLHEGVVVVVKRMRRHRGPRGGVVRRGSPRNVEKRHVQRRVEGGGQRGVAAGALGASSSIHLRLLVREVVHHGAGVGAVRRADPLRRGHAAGGGMVDRGRASHARVAHIVREREELVVRGVAGVDVPQQLGRGTVDGVRPLVMVHLGLRLQHA